METSTNPPAGLGPPPPAELEYDSAAALFPLLPVDSQEFGELVEDIHEHGLIQPIGRFEGKILDGRNRHRACQHAGVEPHFVEWDGESPTAYVLSLNLHRRHLTEDQRAAAVQKARARLEAEAKERMAAAGRKSAPGRPAKKGVADSPQLSPRAPTTRKRLAVLGDVSEHKMRQSERVHKADPELLDQVHAGEVPLAEAATKVDLQSALERYPFIRQASNLPPAAAIEMPDPPAVPKRQRMDSIAATVLELTGWASVDSETTGAVYRWLFGDEARARGGRWPCAGGGAAAHRAAGALAPPAGPRAAAVRRPQIVRRPGRGARRARPGHRAGRAELRGVRWAGRGGRGGARRGLGGVSGIARCASSAVGQTGGLDLTCGNHDLTWRGIPVPLVVPEQAL